MNSIPDVHEFKHINFSKSLELLNNLIILSHALINAIVNGLYNVVAICIKNRQ